MKLRMHVTLGLLAVGLAVQAFAAGPEGSGSVAVQVGVEPSYQDQGVDYASQNYGVTAEAPLGSAAGVQAALIYAPNTADGPTASADFRNYNEVLGLTLHLGGLLDKPFQPGENANADGQLWMPSLTVAYSALQYSESVQISQTNLAGSGNSQDLSAQLILPVATFFSLDLGLSHNLVEQSVLDGRQTDSSGQVNASTLIARLYILHANPSAPFLPHYGRLGQFVLAYIDHTDVNSVTDDADHVQALSLGVPLTAHLGLSVAASQTTANFATRTGYEYSLGFSWALGTPASRVD